MQFLSYLVNGISLGSIYAVIALGYTMVYGIARMLNFAHGDVIMVGGYVAFVMMTSLGLPALAAICAAVVVCTLLGVAIERVAYKPLREAPSLAVLITAIGMSYLLQNLALLIWGSAPKSFTSSRARHWSPLLHPQSSWWRSRCLSTRRKWGTPCRPYPRTKEPHSLWASM